MIDYKYTFLNIMLLRRYIPYPVKQSFRRLLPCVFVAGIFCLSSCEDDTDRPSPSSPVVSFTSEIGSSRTPSTRSTTDSDTPQGTVTALQGGSIPLYLHTLYTDSIALPSSDSRSDRGVLTRATPIKDDNMYESFGVSAYSYTGSWDESQTTPNYFYNATASKSGGSYTLSSTYYWPGSSYKMKFFAYAPTANGQYVLSGRTQAGSPTISVTIPSDVNDQKDLLVAKTDELAGNTNTAVALTFNHALTAIRFVCGDDMQGGTVKSVSLKNVYSKGTYNMGIQSWSNVGSPATFSQTLDKVTTGTADEALTSEAQTFMMLPQQLPEDAQIEILFTDNTHTDHTLTADIKGSEWPMGKTVTYKISSSSINWEYVLEVKAKKYTITDDPEQTIEVPYTGDVDSVTVQSYRRNGLGTKEPVAVNMKFSADGGNTWSDWDAGSWFYRSDLTVSSDGITYNYIQHADAQTGTDSNPHTAVLGAKPDKGSETTPYNLSNSTGGNTVENTANCYVVDAPGYYSIPLVYGNAIKNAATNASAYTSTATGTNILNPFINHTGVGITDPYIANNGCTPAKAELVWQDAASLVTDIKYNAGSNGGNISFKVDRSSIRQGNAVIAIKDASDAILWSWHIWVTDEDINDVIEITNHQNVKYNFMPVNLGQCNGNIITYAERSCKLKITAGDQSREITIKQLEKVIATRDNHPYYEWGRKDPFYPSNGMDNTTKAWYDKEGISSTDNPTRANLSTGAACIKNYILNPNVMHSMAVADRLYLNLWSANNSSVSFSDPSVTIKTIYDPCPVGFRLPVANCFSGFTTTGESVESTSEINGFYDDNRIGWYLYADATKTRTIFFPLSGWRDYVNSAVKGVNGWSVYWYGIPYDMLDAQGMDIGKGYLRNKNRNRRAFAGSVRPCSD